MVVASSDGEGQRLCRCSSEEAVEDGGRSVWGSHGKIRAKIIL